MDITWEQFKKVVEQKGVTNDMKIEYIDITGMMGQEGPDFKIEIDERHNEFKIHD
jgi:hypothetical protein